MNYEKAYKEALERAKGIYEETIVPTPTTKGTCEYIFPELQESEDERIRRKFIEALKECGFTHFNNEFTVQEAINWLEKQGELVNSLSEGLDNAHKRIDGLIQKNNSLVEQLEKKQCENKLNY